MYVHLGNRSRHTKNVKTTVAHKSILKVSALCVRSQLLQLRAYQGRTATMLHCSPHTPVWAGASQQAQGLHVAFLKNAEGSSIDKTPHFLG